MRSIEEIENEIIEAVEADTVLSQQLTSTSRTAIWRLLAYIVAFAIWLHEQIVEKNAENSRPHTLRWYREVALEFVDGQNLIWKDGQFQYDLAYLTDAETEALKKVKHVAVVEAANGKLVIKTATNGSLGSEPLEVEVHQRFKSYMEQIKDAGNRLEYINAPADSLRLTLTVWVDDMIIDMESGDLLNGNGNPVQEACQTYLNEVEFNGAFIKTFLTDKLQEQPGIKIPKIELLEHQTVNSVNWEEIDEYVLPFSGHFKYDLINVTYKKYNEVA